MPRIAGSAAGDVGLLVTEFPVVAAEYLAMAQQVVKVKQAFTRHRDNIAGPAREALQEEIALSAREAEKSIIKILPRLDDEDRGVAIQILTELRCE